jgi:hypothetical protein
LPPNGDIINWAIAGRLVGRVLRNQLALKGALENGLAQPPGAGKVGLDGNLQLLDDRQVALDFGDDALLFSERRKGNRQNADSGNAKGSLSCCSTVLSKLSFNKMKHTQIE